MRRPSACPNTSLTVLKRSRSMLSSSEAFARTFGEVEGGGDAFVERRPVRQIGERIVVRHVRDALFVAFAIGDVVDDADEILQLAVRALHRQPVRRRDARAVAGRNDNMLVEEGDFAAFQDLLVLGFDQLRAGFWQYRSGVFADEQRAVHAQIFLGGAVDQQIPQVRNVLHDDRRRHVFDDGVEERAGVLEFALGFFAFRDILMHRHPSAVLGRMIDDVDDAAVGQFDGDDKGTAARDRGTQIGVVAGRIKREGSGGDASVEQVADGAAAPDVLRIDVVHGPVSLVPDHQPVLRIEHTQTLNHVVERGVELHVLAGELAPDAPGRQRPDQTDTEQRAGNGRQGDRQWRQRQCTRGKNFQRKQRDGKAEHAGKGDPWPVPIPRPVLVQRTICRLHGPTFGLQIARPKQPAIFNGLAGLTLNPR